MAVHRLLLAWLSFFIISLMFFPFIFCQSANYIIHMDLPAMPKAFSSHHHWYSATLSSILNNSATASPSSPSSKLIYSYNHVMNGFSASLTPAELETLKRHPGYISFVRDLPVKIDTTHSLEFIGLNSNSGAWPGSDYGKDVIIAVVDTGVWPESESFNDEGMSEIPSRWKGRCEGGTQFNASMCNKKLIGARYFNKGLRAQDPNLTIEMNSPRDTVGHGTHTSSTAAGSYVNSASYFGYAPGTARGVAPKARVAMYKALWQEGIFVSDIIAAIDQAIMDGADMISLSLGLDSVPLYEDPVAIAAFAAMEKGIFVSTSSGNAGPDLGTLHNGIPWVLNVAAGTMDRGFSGTVVLSNGVSVTGSSLYPGTSFSGHHPIVFIENCSDQEELEKVGYKIVVCEDKNEPLADNVRYVSEAKVAGGVFISNVTNLEDYIQTSFPAVFLDLKNGQIVKSFVKQSSNPEAKLEFQETIFGVKPAPSVASYSSRGPSQSCPFVLKPDIMAPGDNVLAAWPGDIQATVISSGSLYTHFNLLSGTSMACPHAAGVAALLKSVHPEWSPAAVRSAMMTTADMSDKAYSRIEDLGDYSEPASPLAMGAGQINPNKALDPGLIYDADLEDYVNLLCAMNYTGSQIQTITRSYYNCSNPSLDLNYPSFIAFFNENDTDPDSRAVREYERTVTIVDEKGNSTYFARVSGMKGLRVTVKPDRLVFEKQYQKQRFKLRIEGPRTLRGEPVVFGDLRWVESDGKHVVRSPIVASSLSSEVLMQ